MKNVIGLLVSCFGILAFYLIFFKLAPWIGSLIPLGDWTPILKIVVYVLVAWLGGFGVSITLVALGIYIIIS